MTSKNILAIDGSFGEGGGAILRLSVGLSYLFNQPIDIKNIRANRSKPGLRTQHLLGLKTISDLTNSRISDCKLGTKELIFIPNPHEEIKRNLHVNVNTAASIGLLLQPIQIASLGFKNIDEIEINLNGGGTFGKWAPSLNYLKKVPYRIYKKSGLNFDIEIRKHGFYPKGGARVICKISPSKRPLNPINLTEVGNISLILGEIIITKQLRRNNIGIRIKKSIQQQIKRNLDLETDIDLVWVDSISPGVGLSLWAYSDMGAIISTGTILGGKKIRSEDLGRIAANEIIKYINNDIPVDNYLSDQLIPLMAYVKKPSKIKVLQVTNHTQTNLELVKLFTKRNYSVSKEKNNFFIEFR